MLFGMTFNLDTIWVTVVAGATRGRASGSGSRAQLTKDTEDHVPTKLQLAVGDDRRAGDRAQVEGSGSAVPARRPASPSRLFFFILITNSIELISERANDGGHLLPAPTADANLTYALTLLVIVGVSIFGVLKKGSSKAPRALFLGPFPSLLPLNMIKS